MSEGYEFHGCDLAPGNINSNSIYSQADQSQGTMDDSMSIDFQISPSLTQRESNPIFSQSESSAQKSTVSPQTQTPTDTSMAPVNPFKSKDKRKILRGLMPRKKTSKAVVIPNNQEADQQLIPPPITYQRNDKMTSRGGIEEKEPCIKQ
ncbi:uncharacterized protein MELLADRAFT_101660 [Melampsora larici-populina 98AG31]|uniref:Uncharacterized protein n=1 Tax=Melampsora larici-populina (strain 98AG31 / pathotype 3-4-7) TaxID=747676 RepID=F4R6K0_MELLP|nr:uncharacterized protein MELLADRAFT_101660 [Melampsora larici-populina 98AG31]EGG11895.1 hypothetical protein MELLADRAFT_101660 [Melampsora larici-populina 98AG31]